MYVFCIYIYFYLGHMDYLPGNWMCEAAGFLSSEAVLCVLSPRKRLNLESDWCG